MNITELARRMNVSPEELRNKLPALGFSIGRHAIKVDNRIASRIMEAWAEMRRRERLTQKREDQMSQAERQQGAKPAPTKSVALPPILTVREFASRLNAPIPRVMQELMKNGILASLNERIDFDTAAIIAEDLGFKAEPETAASEQAAEEASVDRLREALEAEAKQDLQPRPPVVVVMGHVDHGKTRLLDAIRSTNVMESEAGGITQHIGAYQVERKGQHLTFIDTPGHEAFTVMRSRGAKVADIAILVVAADDGVQPQTKEAINIIQSAHLPFIVALNKIDRPEANVDRVKGELAELNLVPEDWGGKTVMVPISARENINIDTLLDMLLLVSEIEKERIMANPSRGALGTVIESHVDSGAGPVATVLVQAGTLHVGDDIGIRGIGYGRVRGMKDWKGDDLKEAPPSTPAKIIGWKAAPAVGDILEVPESGETLERLKATSMAAKATEEVALARVAPKAEGEEEGASGGQKTLNIILRADVLGSLEAILGMLDTIKHEDVGVKVISKGLGNLTDTDILNAEAAGAMVIGFNVRPTASAEELSRDKGVAVKIYSIIYRLFEDILAELQAMLPSETILTELGTCEVLAVFRKADDGWILGAKGKAGKLLPKSKLRVLRGGDVVGEGEILSLQIGRAEAKEIHGGQEFGLRYRGKTKPEVGDILEAYTEEQKARKLVLEGISKR